MGAPLHWFPRFIDGRPNQLQLDLLMSVGLVTLGQSIEYVCRRSDGHEHELWMRLCPNGSLFGSRPSAYSAHAGSAAGLVVMVEPCIRPFARLTPDQTVDWARHHLLKFSDADTMSDALSKPVELLRWSYHLMRSHLEGHPEDSHQLGACLTLIGCAVLPFFVRRACTCCGFRRAEYRAYRCVGCTDSVRRSGALNWRETAASAQRARRVRAVARDYASTIKQDQIWIARNSVVGVLFADHIPDELAVPLKADIQQSLGMSPRVSSDLPRSFSQMAFHEQLECLRRALDREEFDTTVWPQVIQLAEVWQASNQRLIERRKGPGPTEATKEKARQCLDMLRQGRSSQSIAVALGVSRSYLPKLLQRCGLSWPEDRR